jgi:cell wall-associated NlpC family hydrolase
MRRTTKLIKICLQGNTYPFTTWKHWWLFIWFIIMTVSGCAGRSLKDTTNYDFVIMEQKLRAEVGMWKGTPHQMGGTTRQGVDCSAFVQRLYQDVFNQRIPRTTHLQVKSGQLVEKDLLRMGDLVFFKYPLKGRHVGIYLDQGEFAHASTSKGVTISSLQNNYWRQFYWTARRYL